MVISLIKKRDGRIVKFEKKKIKDAIHKAFVAVHSKDGKIAKKLSDLVVKILNKRYKERIPSVEDVQNIVIEVLKKRGYEKVAKEYSAYRLKKAEIRELKRILKIEEEPKLTVNALEVLKKRYLLKNDEGKIIETPAQMFLRVAKTIAEVDRIYGGNVKKTTEEFYEIMSKLEFLPNSPALFNAGTKTNFGLSACYVLPVEDSLKSIFEAVKNMVIIEQSGGGVGFDFSKLRPKGDIVKSTKGIASGPISFMRVFDIATDVIKQGGRRRGAMMGILRIDHPDILEFITIKSRENILTNFNLSVAITDEFMEAVKNGKEYELINPRNKEVTKKLKAKKVWNLIIESAWKSGDPGLIFIDEINRKNPTPEMKITATNPCGEQPLLDYESCNLGSINLSKMIKENKIDWEKLRKTVHVAVHFLDNVIDANYFPLKEIERITKANRKIGLGVMGWAELLIRLKIPYDSEKAIKLAEKVMKFITNEARKESEELGLRRGSFSNFEKSIHYGKYKAMRNATVTTIAPTGSISIIAGCSSGIEPLFAISFMRNVLEGTRLFEVNPLFERIAKEKGFYSGKLLEEIAKTGSIQKIKEIPKDIRRIFKTALDIKPEWHVKMQAAFQKHVDNAVSKTINLPNKATKNDVRKAFELAYKLKCKGITVYRYGCKPQQVLYIGRPHLTAESEYSGGCPTSICPF
ncbi:MAG: adenosylcobalamin-dependent ribonucleoside-diphosphate reductase [Candidatus Heimdallarchaeaceae archaeon]